MPPAAPEIDALLASVLGLARERAGRLVAITLGGAGAEAACGPLRERLSGCGHERVEVRSRAAAAAGAVRVLSAEYDRR